jgi:chorismate mutase
VKEVSAMKRSVSLKKIESLRSQIDRIDQSLIQLIAKRLLVAEKIGQEKAKLGLPVLQKSRWSRLLKNRLIQGQKNGISKQFMKNLFEMIHKESIQTQKGTKDDSSH